MISSALRLLLPALVLGGCVASPHGADVGPKPDAATDAASDLVPLGAVCDDDSQCRPGLLCEALGGAGLCSAVCAADGDCGPATACNSGRCTWQEGTIGAACVETSDCHPGLDCVQTPSGSFCTRDCGFDTPCPEGEDGRCVSLSQGGAVCLKNCLQESDCAPGLDCTPLTLAPEIKCCFFYWR